MRVLIVKVPHEGNDRYTWILAYSLPFTPVGACNYGSAGDCVTMQLTIPKTPREEKAQEIFVNHVKKIAEEMHKNVQQVYTSRENVIRCACPSMSLSWLTDHQTKGE
jgi:hypothetical protein